MIAGQCSVKTMQRTPTSLPNAANLSTLFNQPDNAAAPLGVGRLREDHVPVLVDSYVKWQNVTAAICERREVEGIRAPQLTVWLLPESRPCVDDVQNLPFLEQWRVLQSALRITTRTGISTPGSDWGQRLWPCFERVPTTLRRDCSPEAAKFRRQRGQSS